MKYSVVIPSYCNNKAQYEHLIATLQLVHANSPKDTEVILVNDGSQVPETGIGNLSPTIYIRHQKNKGIAASWNDGLKLARGEYIAVVNDDITVREGWLDKLRVALEDEEENWVSAPGVEGQANGTGIEETYQWFPGYCFMLSPNCRRSIGLFDEQFSPFDYEDTDYWTRVLKAGGKLVRNYSTTITHIGGHVLHTLDYDNVNNVNNAKFQKKHGFDPIPVFYENKPFDFTTL